VSEFLNMGGYAAYVWPSYGLTLAVVVLNIVWARRLLARSREEARRRLAMRVGETMRVGQT
jgi:heme exporter protein D